MTTLKQNPMVFGLVLVAGAMLYARSRSAQAATAPARNPLPTSMPGSAGSGTQQVVGGILGAFFQNLGMGTAPAVAPYATSPEFSAYVLQNHEVPLGEFYAEGQASIPGITEYFGTLV